jgi:hypothetical protein
MEQHAMHTGTSLCIHINYQYGMTLVPVLVTDRISGQYDVNIIFVNKILSKEKQQNFAIDIIIMVGTGTVER